VTGSLYTHDTKHAKEDYYRLVYNTIRTKVHLPSEHFRSLILRLIGDKDHEKVFDIVAKVEKNFQPRGREREVSGAKAGGAKPRLTCFYCQKVGHVKLHCYKRIADEKNNSNEKNM
jgi:hypothetical protein